MILKADGAVLKKSIAGDFAPSIYKEIHVQIIPVVAVLMIRQLQIQKGTKSIMLTLGNCLTSDR